MHPESLKRVVVAGDTAEQDCAGATRALARKGKHMAQLMTPAEVSLKNILVATDFSAASVNALKCVLPLARQFNSTIHILHVIRDSHILTDAESGAADSTTCQQSEADARRQLERLATMVGAVPHRTWLEEGKVWEAVEDVIRSQQIDLVVVGASGKSELKKFFLGSVAESIIRDAPCPVLAVGPHVSSEACDRSLAQLLYATTLREESHHGLQYAIQLAIRCQSRLLLLHVVEQEEPKHSDHEWLRDYRRLLPRLLPERVDDLPVEPVLRVEVAKNSTARILQVADEVGADLIVMDVRPEETWATHLRDKVFEIISCSKCPVLTVRTKAEHDGWQECVGDGGQRTF